MSVTHASHGLHRYAWLNITYLTLLADMIEQRHRDEQKRLLLHGFVKRRQRAALEEALKAAGPAVSKELLEREDGEGRTPLVVAVQEKQPELVQLLLTAG